jgi:hypothetical protein
MPDNDFAPRQLIFLNKTKIAILIDRSWFGEICVLGRVEDFFQQISCQTTSHSISPMCSDGDDIFVQSSDLKIHTIRVDTGEQLMQDPVAHDPIPLSIRCSFLSAVKVGGQVSVVSP